MVTARLLEDLTVQPQFYDCFSSSTQPVHHGIQSAIAESSYETFLQILHMPGTRNRYLQSLSIFKTILLTFIYHNPPM